MGDQSVVSKAVSFTSQTCLRGGPVGSAAWPRSRPLSPGWIRNLPDVCLSASCQCPPDNIACSMLRRRSPACSAGDTTGTRRPESALQFPSLPVAAAGVDLQNTSLYPSGLASFPGSNPTMRALMIRPNQYALSRAVWSGLTRSPSVIFMMTLISQTHHS